MWRKIALKLVHTDVCYVDARSHSDGQYFVIFIDDYSHKLWAYLLKMKNQVLSVIKEFHAGTKDKGLGVFRLQRILGKNRKRI